MFYITNANEIFFNDKLPDFKKNFYDYNFWFFDRSIFGDTEKLESLLKKLLELKQGGIRLIYDKKFYTDEYYFSENKLFNQINDFYKKSLNDINMVYSFPKLLISDKHNIYVYETYEDDFGCVAIENSLLNNEIIMELNSDLYPLDDIRKMSEDKKSFSYHDAVSIITNYDKYIKDLKNE